MTVYVALQYGDYDVSDDVIGVYTTLEAAQASHPSGRPGDEWRKCRYGDQRLSHWTTTHGDVRIEPHEVKDR